MCDPEVFCVCISNLTKVIQRVRGTVQQSQGPGFSPLDKHYHSNFV